MGLLRLGRYFLDFIVLLTAHGHLRTKMTKKTPVMDDHTMGAIKYVSFVRFTTVHNNHPFVVVVVVVVGGGGGGGGGGAAAAAAVIVVVVGAAAAAAAAAVDVAVVAVAVVVVVVCFVHTPVPVFNGMPVSL